MDIIGKLDQITTRVEKTYHTILRPFGSKKFKRVVMLILTILFAVSMPVAYAQDEINFDETCVSAEAGFSGISFFKGVMGYIGKVLLERDNTTVMGITSLSLGNFLLANLGPQFMCGYEVTVGQNPEMQNNPYATGGVLGILDNANSNILSDPPSVDLVAHLSQDWVPGANTDSAVYAQDGYTMMQELGISELWEQARMLAYAMFVIALIIAGFMIMFRQKIGGQMSVTVFNTIPKIIIGLILVTFSFAIVGLIIDIGATLITVIQGFFGIENPLYVTHPLSIVGVLFRGDTGVGVFTLEGVKIALSGFASITAMFLPLGFLTGAIGGILVILSALVIIAMVAYVSVKVFITLLKAWIGLIVDTVMGPIFLVIAVIPGRSATGRAWFYRVVRNVLTFVGVFLLLNLSIYIYESGVDFYFPASLSGGSTAVTNSPVLGFLMTFAIPLFLFNMAAEVPNFLKDLLPADGGKGAAAAMQGIQKSFAKIPVVGSALG